MPSTSRNSRPVRVGSTQGVLAGKEYWSKTIEKAARAFERYIYDQLDQQGFQNDYLVNIDLDGGAYPTAEEMRADGIEAAFSKLFETLETRTTDQGVELYRRKGRQEPPAEKSPRVRIRLNRRFDKAREGVRGDLDRIGQGHLRRAIPLRAGREHHGAGMGSPGV